MMKQAKIHSVADTAKEIWQMTEQHDFCEDVWAHYKSLLYFGDYYDYKNCHGYFPPHVSRHALSCIGLACPSLAFINPYKTREMGFYLHVATDNLQNPNLQDSYNQFTSANCLLVHQGLACAFYRLVSGKTLHDELFFSYVQQIHDIIMDNHLSAQRVYGIETLTGKYDALINLMGLMVIDLYDRIFGTNCNHHKNDVLKFVKKRICDHRTGLFHDYFHTGSLGFRNEILAATEIWRDVNLTSASNGYALAFMHYFDPDYAESAWQNFKKEFAEELLCYTAADLSSEIGKSYVTALNPKAEGFYGAMFAAREMEDQDFFEKLLKHLNRISGVSLREGKIWFDALGEYQEIHGFYILLAKTHIPFHELFAHDWASYYDYDFNEVR